MNRKLIAWASAIGWLAVIGLVCISSAPVAAAALDLEESERRALERDAGLDQIRAQGESLSEAAVAAGALPDPQLTLGLESLPVDSLSPREDMMSMIMVGARQSFPAGRTRQLSREQGEIQVEAQGHEVEARKRDIRRQVRLAWVRWAKVEARLELARTEAEDFESILETTENRYRSGLGTQRDFARARLERAAVDERILTLEEESDAARAELSRWIGHIEAGAQPGEHALPVPGDGDDLKARVLEHPSLLAEATRLSAAEKSEDIARQAYRPSWMLEASYGHRRARDMDGDRMGDMASFMVGFSLPLFTKDRQDRTLAAARADTRSVHYRRMEQQQALLGALEEQLSRHSRRQDLVALYEERLLDYVADSLSLEFSAYRADRGDFRDLIRARVSELEYRLRLLEMEQQLLETRIELDYLAGGTS